MATPSARNRWGGRIRWFFRQLLLAGRPLLRPVFTTRRYFAWWLFWFAVAVTISSFFSPPLSGAHARYTGLMLELLGIGTVAFGLFRRAHHGEKEGPLARVRAILREVGAHLRSAFRGPRTDTLHAAGMATAQSSTLRAKARVRASADATLERRVGALESRLEGFENETEQLEGDLRKELHEFHEALKQERAARTNDTADIRSHVADVATGELYLEWMGVLWLALGVAFSTLSSEIAGLCPTC